MEGNASLVMKITASPDKAGELVATQASAQPAESGRGKRQKKRGAGARFFRGSPVFRRWRRSRTPLALVGAGRS